MRIKIWGCCGSRPVSGKQYEYYGCDTSCIEVRTDAGEIILLDAGTGLANFAKTLKPGEKPVICLSHLHLDHVQGLPYYPPLYEKGQIIYSPDESLGAFFNGVLFPVAGEALPAQIRKTSPGDKFHVGGALLETIATNHPGGGLAWKITADGWTFVYTGDHEMAQCKETEDLLRFMAGADVALVDGHFSVEDHKKHAGWGHSDFEQWAQAKPEVGQIIFSHFNPDYSDAKIHKMLEEVRENYPDVKMDAAFQGCEIEREGIVTPATVRECPACAFFRKTAHLSDTHAVLDALLTEARRIGRADAGTVYLVENGELSFSAAQNDTLFPGSASRKFSYMNSRIPINRSSIAGYVAATGKSLNIPDVYEIGKDSEYGFNRSFDEKNGYRTRSVLAVPLMDGKNQVAGVLQLINSMSGVETVPFSSDMEKTVSDLAAMATIPLERSFLLIGMILRMLKTSALRDPTETAGHVYRVGGIAAELYHRWAQAHDVEPEQLLDVKGRLRLAAMLHDVGKVGIPDAVLKKPGRLDDAERAKMQEHAALGAGLFTDGEGALDRMAREIALHHHAKWDGSGYTGDQAIASPAGADIPLWARITAIADVYDALVSPRCYKPGMDPDKAAGILRKDAGTHFDPELVECFMEIRDTVDAIIKRYEG